MKNIIIVFTICILVLLLLVGCVVSTGSNYDTSNETEAESDTSNATLQLSAKATKNEDGTYSFEFIGYDENVDYKQHLDKIYINGYELGAFGLPITLEGIENMVANNTWPTKYLIHLADEERRYGPYEYLLPDINMVERIGAFNYESMKVTSVDGIFLPHGMMKINYEYRDPIIDYYYGEIGPYDLPNNNNVIIIYSPKEFEKRLKKYWIDKDHGLYDVYEYPYVLGHKEGIETKIYGTKVYTHVYYETEWNDYKVYAEERYIREDNSIPLTDEVMHDIHLFVINEEAKLYYEIYLCQFNQNPSIEWIKNYVEGKPTSSAVTQ